MNLFVVSPFLYLESIESLPLCCVSHRIASEVTQAVYQNIETTLALLKKLPTCSCYRCKRSLSGELHPGAPPLASSDLDGSQESPPAPLEDVRTFNDHQDLPPNQNKNI
jgi:hypothetical protein